MSASAFALKEPVDYVWETSLLTIHVGVCRFFSRNDRERFDSRLPRAKSSCLLVSKHDIAKLNTLNLRKVVTEAMGDSEIQSWISSARASDENADSCDVFAWRTESIFRDWPLAMTYAQKRLLTSKTKPRIQFLREELLSLAKHGGKSTLSSSSLKYSRCRAYKT